MTDTGWKHPTIVTQDSRKELNNGLSCYAFVNLDNIKKEDETYADQQPWAKTGIDSEHKSPMIYAYNYGFDIPKDATVTKITLFVLVQQVTHPKYYYEHYVLKRELRFSTSKFHHLKLKQGTSTIDGGDGNNMASKCAVQNLPYQTWSTEETTTFTGTPKDWGITSSNVPAVINSNNFGVALQFIGTIKNGWCTPGIAQMRMKVEYTVPAKEETPKSEFTRITVTYQGKEIKFVDDTATGGKISDGIIQELKYAHYDISAVISFNFYHKGDSGETPMITFNSTSLIMGATASSYGLGKTLAYKYAMKSLKVNKDDKETKYTKTLAVFPGLLLGEQRIMYTLNGVVYTLRFDVSGFDDTVRSRYMNKNQQCVIRNCLFRGNTANRIGGASYITSEIYLPSRNIYEANTAKNNYNENYGNACNNVYWLGKCYDRGK